MDYPSIGADYTTTPAQREALSAAIRKLTWYNPKGHGPIPLSPALALKAVTTEFQIPRISLIAYDGMLGPYSLLGVEGNFRNGRVRIYFLDRGSDIITLAADTNPPG